MKTTLKLTDAIPTSGFILISTTSKDNNHTYINAFIPTGGKLLLVMLMGSILGEQLEFGERLHVGEGTMKELEDDLFKDIPHSDSLTNVFSYTDSYEEFNDFIHENEELNEFIRENEEDEDEEHEDE